MRQLFASTENQAIRTNQASFFGLAFLGFLLILLRIKRLAQVLISLTVHENLVRCLW